MSATGLNPRSVAMQLVGPLVLVGGGVRQRAAEAHVADVLEAVGVGHLREHGVERVDQCGDDGRVGIEVAVARNIPELGRAEEAIRQAAR